MTLTLPAEAADWVQVWRDRINESDAFGTAAEGFTADFLFEIQPDDTYDGGPIRFQVTIDDGACTAAAVVDDADYEFALRGPYTAWAAMLRGELDVSESVMDGTFDVSGNTMTLLQRQEAVSEMVVAAQAVDTEFEG